MKGLDLLLKLWFFRKIARGGALDSAGMGMPPMPLSPWLRYSGAMIYPWLFWMGIA